MKEWFRNHTDLMAALLFAGVIAFLVTLLFHSFMLLTGRVDTEPALAKHLRSQGFIVKVVNGNIEAYRPKEGYQFFKRVDFYDDSLVYVAVSDKPDDPTWEPAYADFQILGEPDQTPSAWIGCPSRIMIAGKAFTVRAQWAASMKYMKHVCKDLEKASRRVAGGDAESKEENEQ